jgi:hypothetical protein
MAKAMHDETLRRGVASSVFRPDRLPTHEAFEFMLGLHCRDSATGLWFRGHSGITSALGLRSSGRVTARAIPCSQACGVAIPSKTAAWAADTLTPILEGS